MIQLINKISGRVFKHRDVQLLITVAEMLGHNLDRKHRALQKLDSRRKSFGTHQQHKTTSVSDINTKFNITIEKCENILLKWNKKSKNVKKIRIEAQLFHGSIPLCDPVSTPLIQTCGHNPNAPDGPLMVFVKKKKNKKSKKNSTTNETKEQKDGKYFKRREACIAYMESTVVDISMTPPSFKPVSLSLSRIFSILKHPNKSFLTSK